MDDYTSIGPNPLNSVESIRKRPAMYVGSLDFFGLIHYLVAPVAMLLERRPSRIAVAAADGDYVIESDAVLPIEEPLGGPLIPFEGSPISDHGIGLEGLILNALSERLTVEIRRGDRSDILAFRRGMRASRNATHSPSSGPGTTLRFVPDPSILTVTELSPAVFRSFLRRLSYLHRGVRFSLALEGPEEYYSERGIVDLFTAVAAPYQILHEPIHIKSEDGTFFEAVIAYHSWTEIGLLSFINNGRAVEGGTHEAGFRDALEQISNEFLRQPSRSGRRNGVLAVVSIRYPEAVWQGCIKAKVGNPELRGMVRDQVVRQATRWLQDRPDVVRQLKHITTFQFPDFWMS
jgi:DNA gyrase subunit B